MIGFHTGIANKYAAASYKLIRGTVSPYVKFLGIFITRQVDVHILNNTAAF